MLFPLWIAVWLNGMILAIMSPQLLHSIFGVNTLLSTEMGVYSLVSSSAFWLSLFAGAWLALDPIVKCTYVVVYQHLRSRREGDDLRGLLASLPREQQKKAEMIASPEPAQREDRCCGVVLAAILLGASPSDERARRGATKPKHRCNAHRFRAARNAFKNCAKLSIRNHSVRFIAGTMPSTRARLRGLTSCSPKSEMPSSAAGMLLDFLRELWPRGLIFRETEGRRVADEGSSIMVGVDSGCDLWRGASLFWLRRRRETAQLSIPITADAAAGPHDTAVASERSEDEWFALANRLEGEGELRLGAACSVLGLAGWIGAARMADDSPRSHESRVSR